MAHPEGARLLTSHRGCPALPDPEDYVRHEIRTALQLGKVVVPVLTDGIRMPFPGSLPEDIRTLARRHAFQFTHATYRSDTRRLFTWLESTAEGPIT